MLKTYNYYGPPVIKVSGVSIIKNYWFLADILIPHIEPHDAPSLTQGTHFISVEFYRDVSVDGGVSIRKSYGCPNNDACIWSDEQFLTDEDNLSIEEDILRTSVYLKRVANWLDVDIEDINHHSVFNSHNNME